MVAPLRGFCWTPPASPAVPLRSIAGYSRDAAMRLLLAFASISQQSGDAIDYRWRMERIASPELLGGQRLNA